MENRSPILRFGITTEGRRSSYWRVRAGMKQPELFLERELRAVKATCDACPSVASQLGKR
jgi:hypothetical protein